MHRVISSLTRVLFSSAIILTFFAATASAQYNAVLQGTITDDNKAAVVGAKVTVTNKDTGQNQTATTSDQGFFRVTQLAPGNYSVAVEQAGFKKATVDQLVIKAEATEGINLTLSPGQVTETINVTGEAAGVTLDTETSDVHKAITAEDVRSLPQFGRDPYNLLRTVPGIFGDSGRSGAGSAVNLGNTPGPGGSNRSIFQTENQVQISANGQRVSSNNFEIDGVSVNSLNFGGAAVVTPNQESIKEIQVKSSTYTAEDGRNSGAQVKVVSQNGTNMFHGTGVYKYNSPGLNAFNKYGGPNGEPVQRVSQLLHQFAGSIGGPIIKDKLFFFGSYEGLRNSSNQFFTAFIETPQYRTLVQQVRPNSLIAKLFATPGIEPRIAALLGSPIDLGSPTGATGQYVSLGNPAGGGLDGIPDIQQALLIAPNVAQGNQFNSRFDYNFNANNQLALSMYFTKFTGQQSDNNGQSRPMADILTKPLNSAMTLLYNRTLSATMINEARFNFTRFAFNEIESSPQTNFGIPRIEVEGLPTPGGQRIRFGAPQAETTPGLLAQNTFEFRDTVSKLWGNQGLKFGFEARREQNNNNLIGGARPDYSFVGLFNLANQTPIFEGINADPATGGPPQAQRHFRSSTYALFAQDDWKVRPNLTVNIGLRWEYFSPMSDTDGLLTNILFPANSLTGAKTTPVNQLSNPDRNNFAPRLGVAWSPSRFKDKLVARGGFGIMYNRIPQVLFSNTLGNPPFFARYSICCGTSPLDFGTPFAGNQILFAFGSSNSPLSYPINPALGVGINPATGAPANAGVTASQVEAWGALAKTPNPYVYVYSFDTEYDIGHNLMASVGYQGSLSRKLIRIVNERFLYTVPNQFPFSAIFIPTPDVNANYNALNLRLTRRMAQGFQIDANYRFSKSLDMLSYEGPGSPTNQTFPQNQLTEYGPSDFDVRHNLIVSGLYELQLFKGKSDWTRWLDGFMLNGIVQWHSGLPWTALSGNCVSTPGGPTLCPTRPVSYNGAARTDGDNQAFIRQNGNFPGITTNGSPYFVVGDLGVNQAPGVGRNAFRGPRFFGVDLSVGKRTKLSKFAFMTEGSTLELRANIFNAFNNLNLTPFGFNGGGTNITDPHFGQSPGALAGRVVEFQARFNF